MDESPDGFVIKSVAPDRGYDNTYAVRYVTWAGNVSYLDVWANDEMEAYVEAKRILRRGEKVEKYIIVALTVAVLGLFTLMGYGCSRPSDMEACIAAGKNWQAVEQQQSSDEPSTYSCT